MFLFDLPEMAKSCWCEQRNSDGVSASHFSRRNAQQLGNRILLEVLLTSDVSEVASLLFCAELTSPDCGPGLDIKRCL